MARIDEELKMNFEDSRQRLIANMVYMASWIQNYFTNLLRPYGISMQQFNILRILRGGKGWMTMNDIKGRMVEKAPNATRLADKLLEKEYVERRRSDEDRRVVYLRITSKGLDLLTELDVVLDGNKILEMMERVSLEEAEKASEILDKLRG